MLAAHYHKLSLLSECRVIADGEGERSETLPVLLGFKLSRAIVNEFCGHL